MSPSAERLGREFPGSASLGLYDWPETAEAHDALWAAWAARLANRGVAAPPALARDRDLEDLWRDPALLVGHACGLPFVDGRCPGAHALATPVYAAEGSEGPYYASWIVAPRASRAAGPGDLGGGRAAVNGLGSLSGWGALKASGARPGALTLTGAHRASARAVAAGEADMAAIDTVVWMLLARFEPETVRGLRRVCRTERRPAPLLIAGADASPERRAALVETLDEALAARETAEARATLGLTGAVALPAARYAPLAALAPTPTDHGLVT